MNNYLVVTIKPWNIRAFELYSSELPGQWYLITTPEALTAEHLAQINPRYIFFPHWSWLVPEHITTQYECICFHMTDVPYGRGGSPLQNLILRGHKTTHLTALRMVREMDAGPVYGKLLLSLEGSAQTIYERAAHLVYSLISRIVEEEPTPREQTGLVTPFQRRTPEQSRLPLSGSLEQLYDHIRMLDANSYPHAFIEYGDFRMEFTDAANKHGNLSARVIIKKTEKKSD